MYGYSIMIYRLGRVGSYLMYRSVEVSGDKGKTEDAAKYPAQSNRGKYTTNEVLFEEWKDTW